jgi:hypothetical protein
MFKMNSEDPQKFVDYVGVKYPGLRTHIPRHGERKEVQGLKYKVDTQKSKVQSPRSKVENNGT